MCRQPNVEVTEGAIRDELLVGGGSPFMARARVGVGHPDPVELRRIEADEELLSRLVEKPSSKSVR